MMNTKTKSMVLIGVLAAMSSALMFFPHFPLIPAFPWLDFDFSDVPSLLAAVAISPVAGGIIVLIKNVIHLSISSTAMIGELANFIICFSFVVTAGLLSKYCFRNKLMTRKLIPVLLIASVVQVVAASLVNYFIMIPLYSAFVNFTELGGAQYYILAGVVPFNLIKDLIVCVAFYLVYRYVYPHVQKQLY